ncbi:MAG TPA: tetratricopeptide repeat protein, partial [Steroidobacteraceae bacterium]|nr:tetratricopeptide repeat protein [Steroidobacteraceae bacterium]
AIVGMAMRKEPDKRYASVEALADDLRRHLLGQPVRARQGDWRYNASKFLRRNLLAVVATAAVFVGLAVIAGVTLWQNHRISLARDATALERDRAQQVSAFMVDVFSQADPYIAQGKEPTAKDVLDQGAEKIKGNLNLQPEVRAQLLESIGLAYRRQGLNDRAIPLFEQAVAIRRGARPVDNGKLAAALANLSQALNDAGRLAGADANIKEAVALSRSGPPSVETADILYQYATFSLNAKSDPEAATKLFTEALGIFRSVPGDQRLGIASTLGALSGAAQWAGKFANAEQLIRDSINLLGATVGRNHPDYATAMGNLGYLLMQQGKYADAELTLNEAIEIERGDFGVDNPRVATIEADLGTVYEREGDPVRAMKITQDALRIVSQRLDPNHYLVGYFMDAVAKLYLDAGNLDAAERTARQVLAIYEKSLPARHLYVAATRHLLGEALLRREQFTDAERELRAALDIDVATAGVDNWRAARAEASLGWLLIAKGNAAEGEPMLVAARSKLLQSVGPLHPEVALASQRLAQYYRLHHRDADATRVLAEVKQVPNSVLR